MNSYLYVVVYFIMYVWKRWICNT